VSELEDCCGSVLASCCCYKLVAETGDSLGTQRKRSPFEAVSRQRPVKPQHIEKT
jgi:hypothetical protein